MLLNSLAVSFCLDVDDQLSTSTSVLPRSLLRRFDVSGNGKRPLVDDEALWAPIARALLTHAHPDRVRRQLDLTPMLVVGSSFVTLLVSAWEMQSKTSWGEKFVWYDDDNKIATASPFWASGSENHYTAVPKYGDALCFPRVAPRRVGGTKLSPALVRSPLSSAPPPAPVRLPTLSLSRGGCSTRSSSSSPRA